MNYRRLRLLAPLATTLYNLLLAYVLYFIARITFLLENWSYFSSNLTGSHLLEMLSGGLMFDTSAIMLTNSLYIVMMLLPVHQVVAKPVYQKICRGVFLAVNGLALAMNLCDAVYFQFTMRRTTTTIFDEFSNEGNLGSIFLTETFRHFYLLILFVLLMWCVYRLYRKSTIVWLNGVRLWHYNVASFLSLLLIAPFAVAGIRGGFTTAVRPITISNANQYVNHPTEAALVLNTPFSLYRTIGKAVFVVPNYYSDEQEMTAIYNPVHVPNDTVPMTKKNVVVLIVESFGREYIGALNKTLENGRYRGYGRKSIDGMPSILSSIPMFVEPFFLTPASMNHVDGIASLLAGEGYQTAFFHGAQRGSMGFQAFARSTGFQDYYGREDYDADERFGGDDDFDGMWAIWDEPFLQYYAAKISEMKEPFMTAVFTASSHHPFAIPEKYQKQFPEENLEIHKCIRYTDMAIGKFFETASREPWFKNTIFVLTSDHTNMSDHPEYQTDLGGFCSPIIIYEPGREPEVLDKIAQQIDILPTVMGMLHYQKPYFGFGIDLLTTPAEDTWAVNYMGGIYQYVKNGHVLQFDGQSTRGIYALSDSLMKHNLIDQPSAISHQPQMERELKAIIQQYMERMTQDRLR